MKLILTSSPKIGPAAEHKAPFQATGPFDYPIRVPAPLPKLPASFALSHAVWLPHHHHPSMYAPVRPAARLRGDGSSDDDPARRHPVGLAGSQPPAWWCRLRTRFGHRRRPRRSLGQHRPMSGHLSLGARFEIRRPHGRVGQPLVLAAAVVELG